MTTSNSQQKNFIASLFDFGFTSFVTLRFLKVIYAIFVVLILLVGVLVLITSFRGGGIGVVGGLIVAPIITVFYLVLTRITFEVIAMFFRIGDNTYLAVQLLSGGRAGQWAQGGQPGYGPPAPYGSPAVPGAQWGYGTGSGDAAGSAPAGSQYGAPQPTYGQPQPNYGQPQQNYGQPQPNYGQPQDSSGGPFSKSSENPPSQPGQQGWAPGQPPPTQ